MRVNFFNEEIEFPSIIEQKKVEKWLIKVLESHQKRLGTINVIFTSERRILEVNRQYLEHDYYTDIITFDYSEEDKMSGDLFISIDTVKSNAKQFADSYSEELHRVLVHGVLHLIGFKDKTDNEAVRMREEEGKALDILKELNKAV